jgi:hypothetical protein
MIIDEPQTNQARRAPNSQCRPEDGASRIEEMREKVGEHRGERPTIRSETLWAVVFLVSGALWVIVAIMLFDTFAI